MRCALNSIAIRIMKGEYMVQIFGVVITLFWVIASLLDPSVAQSCCIITSPRLAGPEISLLAASEKRLFEKHGLKSDFQFSESKWIGNQLRRGRDMVGILPATLAAELLFRDKNLVIFATLFKGWDYCLWASPSIKDFKARVPIPVVVAKGFAMDRLAAYEAFAKYNIPAKDIKLKAISGITGMMAEAQKAKGVVVLTVPWKPKAEQMGLEKLYDLSALEENIPHTVMVTTRNYLKYSLGKLKGVISTFQESLSFAKVNEGYIKSLIEHFYHIDDKRVVESIYNFYILERMTYDIRPTKDMWVHFTDVVKKVGWSDIQKVEALFDEEANRKLFD